MPAVLRACARCGDFFPAETSAGHCGACAPRVNAWAGPSFLVAHLVACTWNAAHGTDAALRVLRGLLHREPVVGPALLLALHLLASVVAIALARRVRDVATAAIVLPWVTLGVLIQVEGLPGPWLVLALLQAAAAIPAASAVLAEEPRART